MKNALRAFLFLGIGIFLVYLAIRPLSIQERSNILDSIAKADPFWVSLCFVLIICSHIARSLRWSLLIESAEKKPGEVLSFFSLMTGYLANCAVPRLGEISRCGILSRYSGIPVEKLIGTVVAERMIDLLSLLLVCLLAAWSEWSVIQDLAMSKIILPIMKKTGLVPWWQWGMSILVLGITFYWFMKRRRKTQKGNVKNRFAKLVDGFKDGLTAVFSMRKKGLFLLYSILVWGLYVLTDYFAFFVFEPTAHLNFGASLSVLVMGSFAMVAVQGGIGALPLFVMLVLKGYGIREVDGLAFGWMIWAAQFLLVLLLGLASFPVLALYHGKQQKRPMADASAEANESR